MRSDLTTKAFKDYLAQVQAALDRGDATEHTHRPALKTLLETLAPGITATNEPRRVACGAPDYVISKDSPHGPLTIGWVEAKDVGESLDQAERSEQLKDRYLPAQPNVVLTDYLEFRWYVNGERRGAARLATVSPNGRLKPDVSGIQAVADLLAGFAAYPVQEVTRPRELAERMARLAHIIRDVIVQAFERDEASDNLAGLRQALEAALVPDLKVADFADMFSQTLAYGLFAAKVNHRGPRGSFRRAGAAAAIPKTNPFLRQLFESIAGVTLEAEPFAGLVDDLTQLLDYTDIGAVLSDFGKRTRQEDPVVHFYETFLAAYDPDLREKRGVYYTPLPLVNYIVRSVDSLLRERFGCTGGLAEEARVRYPEGAGGEVGPRVLILDPACGTGTFLYAVVDLIREEFRRQGNAGRWPGYVREQLLPRLFAFELLMAPYAVAHLKLSMQLAAQDMPAEAREDWGYDFSGNERLGIYLTNSLEEAAERHPTFFGLLRMITEEAAAAARVKRVLPIMVVLGNPPYSGHSANRSWVLGPKGKRVPTFIGRLLEDYRKVDGHPLGERNPKWLQDDYVKFIRFGQWRVSRTGAGVLAFVTNHGYLDNPTFRGMRQHLMNEFTDIYLLNLHGNAKKKERPPEGGRDENVFDIQQGVAVGIFVKDPTRRGPAAVRYADLWGLQKHKDEWLAGNTLASTEWRTLSPKTPNYLFIPQADRLKDEYQSYPRITDLMPVHSPGIVTARDSLAIAWSPEEMLGRVREFERLHPEEARARFALGDDVRDWKVVLAQQDVRDHGFDPGLIRPILYRPFDVRYTYYTGRVRGFMCRPRPGVMKYMLPGDNLALMVARQGRPGSFASLVTMEIAGHKSLAVYDINTVLPLYLGTGDHRDINLAHAMIGPWGARLAGGTPGPDAALTPEGVVAYLYAILHSPGYRARYGGLLALDYPRIPLTSDRDLFQALAAKGDRLVALHTMTAPQLGHAITNYPVPGSNVVAPRYPKYFPPGGRAPDSDWPLERGRVYISADEPASRTRGQYFEGVSPEVWDFHIGGYQVCERWLRDRRGRRLTNDDLTHYERIVVALSETIRIMREIDEIIPGWPLP